MIKEINKKVNMLLIDEMEEIDKDEIGIMELSLKIPVRNSERPKIPKKISLTKQEKEIARIIYESGTEGVSLEKISKEIKSPKEKCHKIIEGIMKKKVPIQSSKNQDIYRFEQSIMEAQALHNFLELNKN